MEAEIWTLVLMIERSECSLIWAAEAKGEVIDFRPTTSPQAVLCVRLDRQPDQEAPRHLTHQFPGNRSAVECGYSSGFCRMMTLVPTGTRSYRSATSVLTSRKQPDETAVPIVSGRLVP